MEVTIFPLRDFPLINPGDDLGAILIKELQKIDLIDGDIIVIAHTIVSKAENKVYNLREITPSSFAKQIGELQDKDPRKVEVVLRESREIIRMNERVLISETKHGFICANSGVDKSNTPGETVIALPDDPDLSAQRIRNRILSELGKTVAIIISDTFGRPFRVGTVNVAIGVAGINPVEDLRGRFDLFGYEMQSTIVAKADEVSTAAGLVMGQADEGTPVIIVRGVKYSHVEASVGVLNRDPDTDVFR
ncbi:MAG: coenzyme F420-0:L-glutamate ligase [Candidatus Heimdallarchaeota archaeon]|nr:MAG: coenzyme F420-0:L-glutamate ligase [Candidatus Heimdallarchaeota archaeon]